MISQVKSAKVARGQFSFSRFMFLLYRIALWGNTFLRGTMRISFIIQGAIQSFTRTCCESIRRHFPDSEIILSTWKGENVAGLSYDLSILSDDPGAGKMNVRRQMVSTLEGLKAASNPISMKVRSDVIFKGTGCLSHFEAYKKRTKDLICFEERIVIPNMQTIDPENQSPESHWHRCFNSSDWVMLGKTTDLHTLFNAPADRLMEADNTLLSPEQFIWMGMAGKYGYTLKDMNEMSLPLQAATFKFFANNLVVLDTYSQFQMYSGKYHYQKEDWPHFLRYAKWQEHYNKL